MRRILTILFTVTTLHSFAINYYVNPAGNDNNNGLTTATAFKTLNHAALQTAPGDTVFVMNGIYTNPYSFVLSISNSGTATNRIVYMNYPSHSPVVKMGNTSWQGISIQGADYITIDGFTVIGNNDSITLAYAQSQQNNLNNPATSGNGIGIVREFNNPANLPHHNIVRNCTISKCGGAGIYTSGADYTTIENNIISECAFYSPYAGSGIGLYQNWNSDSSTAIKNYIVGNTCYRNEEYIPLSSSGSITDGNGIIIDDARNTQNGSTLGVYIGKTYVANNLVFDNGGRGIHCYLSDKVIIVNNTCYQNCQSLSVPDGEFTAQGADSVFFINNIAFPSPGIPPMYTAIGTTNITVDHNLWAANSGLANPYGTNTVTASPDFILPSVNPLIADFHLQANSAAKNTGTHFYAPNIDKDGNARLLNDSIDIGCFELPATTGISNINREQNSFSIFPNPATETISIHTYNKNSDQLEVNFHASLGENIKTVTAKSVNGIATINISTLANGVYFVRIIGSEHPIATGRFIKIQ